MSETMLSGKVTGVNGNMVSVAFDERVIQNEVAYVITADGERLKSEVIRVRGREADLQVFENTNGVKVGDKVEFSGELLSVELGPGLLTQVYDGLQNPLPELAERAGYFLKRGLYVYPLDREKTWDFTPTAEVDASGRRRNRYRAGGDFQAQDHVAFCLAGRLEADLADRGGGVHD
jgi:V/A-type H+-transporting ATPase subunit A